MVFSWLKIFASQDKQSHDYKCQDRHYYIDNICHMVNSVDLMTVSSLRTCGPPVRGVAYSSAVLNLSNVERFGTGPEVLQFKEPAHVLLRGFKVFIQFDCLTVVLLCFVRLIQHFCQDSGKVKRFY
jgi:hypothetical protein